MATIKDLLEAGQIEEALKAMKPKEGVVDFAKEYGNDRTLRPSQVGKRQDKKLKNEVVTVAKIPIPFQRKIVQSGAAFLFGSPVGITSSDGNIEQIKDLWKKCRLDALFLSFAETVKSETEAALVFYSVERPEGLSIKSRLLNSDNGTYYPVFDEYGDMVAFCWRFYVTSGSEKKERLRVFTADKIVTFEKDKTWAKVSSDANLFGKIPVVYHSQKNPEWWEVKELIDRYEMNLSKFADTNDYFASPMYKAKGAVKAIPKKDDTGKIIKLDIIETDSGRVIEADLDVISWDRAPEALELEFRLEKELIYGMTDTVDWSHLKEQGLGNISGVALKLLFFGSILKAKRQEGDYNTAVSRALNILKAGAQNILRMGNFERTEFDIEFTSVLPDNLKETIETLFTATGGKPLISQETATSLNPYVSDAPQEVIKMQAEARLSSFNLTDN
jgi:SPP1 family phage portal protein